MGIIQDMPNTTPLNRGVLRTLDIVPPLQHVLCACTCLYCTVHVTLYRTCPLYCTRHPVLYIQCLLDHTTCTYKHYSRVPPTDLLRGSHHLHLVMTSVTSILLMVPDPLGGLPDLLGGLSDLLGGLPDLLGGLSDLLGGLPDLLLMAPDLLGGSTDLLGLVLHFHHLTDSQH